MRVEELSGCARSCISALGIAAETRWLIFRTRAEGEMKIAAQGYAALIGGTGGDRAVVGGVGRESSGRLEGSDARERIVSHSSRKPRHQEGAGVDGRRFHGFVKDNVNSAVGR